MKQATILICCLILFVSKPSNDVKQKSAPCVLVYKNVPDSHFHILLTNIINRDHSFKFSSVVTDETRYTVTEEWLSPVAACPETIVIDYAASDGEK